MTSRKNLFVVVLVALLSTAASGQTFDFAFEFESGVSPGTTVALDFNVTTLDSSLTYFSAETTVAGVDGLGALVGDMGTTATITGMDLTGTLMDSLPLLFPPTYVASNFAGVTGPHTDDTLFRLLVDIPATALPNETWTFLPTGSFVSDGVDPYGGDETAGGIQVAIPEPAGMLLLCAAALGGTCLRRRRT